MTKKKMPQTIEECNAEMERTQQKIRQYENRNKMPDRKLAIEKCKERNHRLCFRGGYMESITPELIDMTDEEAKTFLRLILHSTEAREFLRKRAEGATTEKDPCTQGRTYTPWQVCALCRGLMPALRQATGALHSPTGYALPLVYFTGRHTPKCGVYLPVKSRYAARKEMIL